MTTKNNKLWFDVENKRYTTPRKRSEMTILLWFDVENKRYTTIYKVMKSTNKLWFDVENKRYTTEQIQKNREAALWFDVEIFGRQKALYLQVVLRTLGGRTWGTWVSRQRTANSKQQTMGEGEAER